MHYLYTGAFYQMHEQMKHELLPAVKV